MKQFFLVLIILVIQINDSYAQQRCYSYDNAGNRIQRACNAFKIVDSDSQENIFSLEVEFRTEGNELVQEAAIVPNPTSGIIEIVAKGFGANATWDITTQEGRTLMSGPIILGQKTDVSHLPAGLYNMRIIDRTKLITKSFIIIGQ